MELDRTTIVYEDELPKLTDEEYNIWYKESWVDGVRLGYAVIMGCKQKGRKK